jgi:hypothetical protein
MRLPDTLDGLAIRVAGSCGQVRIFRICFVVVVAAGTAVACGGDSGQVAAPQQTVTVTATITAPPNPSPTATPKATVAVPKVNRGVVPNVVGMNHQLAQDTMQAAGYHNLTEEDATGQGRLLISDRNWVVVEQEPRPGTKAPSDKTIILRSKKISD